MKQHENNSNEEENEGMSGLGIGLFHDNEDNSKSKLGGLQQLIRENTKERSTSKIRSPLKTIGQDTDSDREIEYAPIREEPLPFVPFGYTPFTPEDINKLKTFHSSYKLDSPVSTVEDADKLLALETIETSVDDEAEWEHEVRHHRRRPTRDSNDDSIDLVPLYNGEGLDEDDLQDLLADLH